MVYKIHALENVLFLIHGTCKQMKALKHLVLILQDPLEGKETSKDSRTSHPLLLLSKGNMKAKPQALHQGGRAEEMTQSHVWQRPGQKPSKEDGTRKEKPTKNNQPGTDLIAN